MTFKGRRCRPWKHFNFVARFILPDTIPGEASSTVVTILVPVWKDVIPVVAFANAVVVLSLPHCVTPGFFPLPDGDAPPLMLFLWCPSSNTSADGNTPLLMHLPSVSPLPLWCLSGVLKQHQPSYKCINVKSRATAKPSLIFFVWKISNFRFFPEQPQTTSNLPSSPNIRTKSHCSCWSMVLWYSCSCWSRTKLCRTLATWRLLGGNKQTLSSLGVREK